MVRVRIGKVGMAWVNAPAYDPAAKPKRSKVSQVVKGAKPKDSPRYLKVLAEINKTPEILSALYDLNLLPEMVDDKITATSKTAMLAFFAGYKVGKGEWKGR